MIRSARPRGSCASTTLAQRATGADEQQGRRAVADAIRREAARSEGLPRRARGVQDRVRAVPEREDPPQHRHDAEVPRPRRRRGERVPALPRRERHRSEAPRRDREADRRRSTRPSVATTITPTPSDASSRRSTTTTGCTSCTARSGASRRAATRSPSKPRATSRRPSRCEVRAGESIALEIQLAPIPKPVARHHHGAVEPRSASSSEAAKSPRSRFGAIVLGHFDVPHGGAALVGVTADVIDRVNARAGAILGPHIGALRRWHVRVSHRSLSPVHHGRHAGVLSIAARATASAAPAASSTSVNRHLAFVIEAGVEHEFNLEMGVTKATRVRARRRRDRPALESHSRVRVRQGDVHDRISMSLIDGPGRFRAAVASALLCSMLILVCCGDGGHGRLEPIVGWDLDYTGDCTGSDIAATTGSATPDPTRCATPTDDGLIAVCWDQTTYAVQAARTC